MFLSPPSSARLPMPVFRERVARTRNREESEDLEQNSKAGVALPWSVCRSSEEGVERMTVCLWMSERVEMRASCDVERSYILGDVECVHKALQHGVMPLSFSCPTERPGGILKSWLSGPPF